VCGTKNFISVRLYSAPQSHWTIVAILEICAFGEPVQAGLFAAIKSDPLPDWSAQHRSNGKPLAPCGVHIGSWQLMRRATNRFKRAAPAETRRCLLIGAKPTSCGNADISVSDPERTLGRSVCGRLLAFLPASPSQSARF
jgi:hypothetical protein